MFSLPPSQLQLPTSVVELSVRCSDLADMDVMSKSDPVCVLSLLQGPAWLEFGRTEQIEDSLCPSWQKKFVMDYKFEERQHLKFAVYDLDSSSSQLEDHDFLGSIEVTLADIVASQSRGFSRPLKGKGGKIHILSEELSSNKEEVTFTFSAQNLDKKDFFGKSDPYLEISRSTESGQYTVIHRTEVVRNNLNPQWNKFSLPVQTLCNGDYHRDLLFSVFDWDSDGSHDFIGSFHTNLHTLADSSGQKYYDCINEKKQIKKGSKYTNSGKVILQNISIITVPSFLDYIQGGTQVNFTVAVDFTGSNGHPQDPRSLHYMDPSGQPNQYVTAVTAVGDIIQDYDHDKQFPALGFGAKIPPHFSVSHEFFLNLSSNSPFCQGVEGVLAAYYTALHSVQLYGPTNFSPVINHVANFATVYQSDPSQYFVLLIITDGIITDLDATKMSIIKASSLPMSIIIIGVGDADFTEMNALDSDDRLLRHNNLVAKRDIVQFVELRQFVRGSAWSKDILAKHVLAEIPTQLSSWMRMQSFKPLQTNTINEGNIQT